MPPNRSLIGVPLQKKRKSRFKLWRHWDPLIYINIYDVNQSNIWKIHSNHFHLWNRNFSFSKDTGHCSHHFSAQDESWKPQTDAGNIPDLGDWIYGKVDDVFLYGKLLGLVEVVLFRLVDLYIVGCFFFFGVSIVVLLVCLVMFGVYSFDWVGFAGENFKVSRIDVQTKENVSVRTRPHVVAHEKVDRSWGEN